MHTCTSLLQRFRYLSFRIHPQNLEGSLVARFSQQAFAMSGAQIRIQAPHATMPARRCTSKQFSPKRPLAATVAVPNSFQRVASYPEHESARKVKLIDPASVHDAMSTAAAVSILTHQVPEDPELLRAATSTSAVSRLAACSDEWTHADDLSKTSKFQRKQKEKAQSLPLELGFKSPPTARVGWDQDRDSSSHRWRPRTNSNVTDLMTLYKGASISVLVRNEGRSYYQVSAPPFFLSS